MAIIELYSSRKKRESGVVNEVYEYDETTEKLRIQILQIIFEILGKYSDRRDTSLENTDISFIRDTLCREYGVFSLSNARNAKDDLTGWFLREADIDGELDFIELTFKYLEMVVAPNISYYMDTRGYRLRSDAVEDAILELNHRFKENSIGYQYIESMIIRVDSQFIHTEVVKPVLVLLSESNYYAGSADEFLSAHEHFRHGKYKECLVDCLKSFESLMKAIHIKRNWPYDAKKSTAKDLINGCLKNGLIPAYLQNQFSAINSILESGIPTIRNREAGHGQGEEIKNVEEHLCSYMLHITASNLLFLAECERNI